MPVGPEPDMSLLSDDEPERNLLASVPLDQEFLPALSGPDAPVNQPGLSPVPEFAPQPADRRPRSWDRRRDARGGKRGRLQLGQPAPASRHAAYRAAARHRPGHGHRQHLPVGPRGVAKGLMSA
ncbi:hypothetical protein ACVXG7_25290 [Enterobacter hormaechei]